MQMVFYDPEVFQLTIFFPPYSEKSILEHKRTKNFVQNFYLLLMRDLNGNIGPSTQKI